MVENFVFEIKNSQIKGASLGQIAELFADFVEKEFHDILTDTKLKIYEEQRMHKIK